jgi:uncharacterized membrane protein
MTAVSKARTPKRLSGFANGVSFSTVFVLDLRPSRLPTFQALLSLSPTWLSYAASYLFIALVWINHHRHPQQRAGVADHAQSQRSVEDRRCRHRFLAKLCATN